MVASLAWPEFTEWVRAGVLVVGGWLWVLLNLNLNHNLNPNRYRYRRSVSGDGGSKSLSMKHGEDGGNKSTECWDFPLLIRWFDGHQGFGAASGG